MLWEDRHAGHSQLDYWRSGHSAYRRRRDFSLEEERTEHP